MPKSIKTAMRFDPCENSRKSLFALGGLLTAVVWLLATPMVVPQCFDLARQLFAVFGYPCLEGWNAGHHGSHRPVHDQKQQHNAAQ